MFLFIWRFQHYQSCGKGFDQRVHLKHTCMCILHLAWLNWINYLFLVCVWCVKMSSTFLLHFVFMTVGFFLKFNKHFYTWKIHIHDVFICLVYLFIFPTFLQPIFASPGACFCGGTWYEPKETRGEHANSTQKGPLVNPHLLWVWVPTMQSVGHAASAHSFPKRESTF